MSSIIVPAILAGLAVAGILTKRTLLGMAASIQILFMAVALFLVLVGALSLDSAGTGVHAHAGGFFITTIGVAQLVTLFALAVRLFYHKRKINLSELRTLKH